MQDLIAMQVHHQIADCHRMMARVNGGDGTATPPARREGIREAVARALIALATRLASATAEPNTT